jgi:hypothetical protein
MTTRNHFSALFVAVTVLVCGLASPRASWAGQHPGAIPVSCSSQQVEGPYAGTTVVNISGYHPDLYGNLRLDLPPEVTICDYKLEADWGDDEVEFMQLELDRLLKSSQQIVIVGYSMSVPFAGEMLDLWETPIIDPDVVDRLDLVLVAPAAEIKKSVKGFVVIPAKRWAHAWRVHFEKGLMRRNHLPEWSALLDRTSLVLAGNELVVDYDGMSDSVNERFAGRIIVAKGTTHLDLRWAPAVSQAVSKVLRAQP